MSLLPPSDTLTDEQSDALESAAYKIISARAEAADLLTGSGLDPGSDGGWFPNPCGALLPPPPQHHPCGCSDYRGDGGLCLTSYLDLTGPDLGSGPPRRFYQHRASQHLAT